MRRLALALVIALSAALPAAGQTTVGVRAGMGIAWMGDVGLGLVNEDHAPCPPDTVCPVAADEAVRGLIVGVDFDVPASDSDDVFGFRIGAAYAQKGGAGSGYDASGTISTRYLQFSMLLRARAARPPDRRSSLVVMVGPWAAGQLSCDKEGDLGVDCRALDAGIAFGAGVEWAWPGSSRARVGMDAMYYLGVWDQGGYSEATRFAAVQVGLAYTTGGGDN